MKLKSLPMFGHPVGNEKGSAIILSVIMLAVLSVIGLSSTGTSTLELRIAHNEKIYYRNFYQAESAAYEGAQRIESQTSEDELRPATTTYVWLKDDSVDLETVDSALDNASSSLVDAANAFFAANAHGIVKGGSLDMTKSSNMYRFTIYGVSLDQDGEVFIKIGYKKRY